MVQQDFQGLFRPRHRPGLAEGHRRGDGPFEEDHIHIRKVMHIHILGHYMENAHHTQFGLLREDHTPRPGYVALAALGRLLAGAESLGRHEVDGEPNVHLYAFRAKPQGQSQDVLVAWTEEPVDWPKRGAARADWPSALDLAVESAWDYLGRPVDAAMPDTLRPDPVFLVLPEGAAQELSLRTVKPAPSRAGTASPVVFQFAATDVKPVQRQIGWSPEAAYEFDPGTTNEATLTVYNLGESAVDGRVKLADLPEGWNAKETAWDVDLAPMAQHRLHVSLTLADNADTTDVWLDFRGDFGTAGTPVLSVWSRTPPEE